MWQWSESNNHNQTKVKYRLVNTCNQSMCLFNHSCSYMTYLLKNILKAHGPQRAFKRPLQKHFKGTGSPVKQSNNKCRCGTTVTLLRNITPNQWKHEEKTSEGGCQEASSNIKRNEAISGKYALFLTCDNNHWNNCDNSSCACGGDLKLLSRV